MNKNAKQWVRALRSGTYQQARGRLRIGDGYCCLGVLCELYRQSHPAAEWKNDRWGDWTFYGTHATAIPSEVMEWVGLQTHDGRAKRRLYSLAGYNDKGKTFAEIADVIESEPKGLFTS